MIRRASTEGFTAGHASRPPPLASSRVKALQAGWDRSLTKVSEEMTGAKKLLIRS